MGTIKLNWGTRIIILYIGFMALIITLVAGSMRQSFDLVTPDYYGEEIKYQQVIDAGKNQSGLSSPVSINADVQNVTIKFPAEFNNQVLSGTVQFYSPVNAKWDKTFPIQSDVDEIVVPRSQLRNTHYKIKINWSAGGKQYYQASEIDLK